MDAGRDRPPIASGYRGWWRISELAHVALTAEELCQGSAHRAAVVFCPFYPCFWYALHALDCAGPSLEALNMA